MSLINLFNLVTVNRFKIYQGQPTVTAVTMYTCPAGTDVMIASIIICNTTGTAATLTLNVRSTTAGVTNQIFNTYSVPANDTKVFVMPVMMTAGDIISGLQGTSGALTVTISGESYA